MKSRVRLITAILTLLMCALAQTQAKERKDRDHDKDDVKHKSAAVKITKGPTVEHVDNDSATVAWSTNVNASTVLKYGTDPNRLEHSAQAPWGGLTHRVILRHLKPDTTYFYRVESGQAQGTGTDALSQVAQLHTHGGTAHRGGDNSGEVRLTKGPIIEHVDHTWATIAWSTAGKGTTVLRYGSDPNNLNQVAHDVPESGATNRVYLRNLQPNTTYFYQVSTEDGSRKLGSVGHLTTHAGQRAKR